ncbi:TetR/AcrR family transcriptional regulator [Streptomyces candidus]|nr:TetR/AcrR family transcriptional regulator [Streptomyces candidus]
MRPERGARGPAAGHSRTELAAAAVALADREGLAAVSMRRIARELGVGQSSLYRYLAGRDDLLDLMTDRVTGETDLSVPLSGDPAEDLLGLADRTRAVLLRHRWLADVPPEPLRLGPCGLAYLEYALRALAPAGLPGPVQLEVVAVMNALVAQFARTEQQDPVPDAGRRAAQAAYLSSAAAGGEHPHLAAALAGQIGQAGQADAAQATTEAAGVGAAVFRRTMRRVLDALVLPRGAR